MSNRKQSIYLSRDFSRELIFFFLSINDDLHFLP